LEVFEKKNPVLFLAQENQNAISTCEKIFLKNSVFERNKPKSDRDSFM
jgi:hypothetical protein